MAGEQRRPGLPNVILFARLGCHMMIARLGQWDLTPVRVLSERTMATSEGLRKQIMMSQSRRDLERFRCALGKTPN